MKKNLVTLLIIGLSIFFSSCAQPLYNYYSGIQPERTIKEKVECFIKYIATTQELDTVKELTTDEELNDFLIQFWQKRDTDPSTEENEFKEAHIKRFTYANTYLGGWQTDKARVYILYGAPDEILNEMINNSPENIFRDLEIWGL